MIFWTNLQMKNLIEIGENNRWHNSRKGQETCSFLYSNLRQNSCQNWNIWLVEAGNLLLGLEFTGKSLNITYKHIISDSRDVPQRSNWCHSVLINTLQAPNRHYRKSWENNSHNRKHCVPEYSYPSANVNSCGAWVKLV